MVDDNRMRGTKRFKIIDKIKIDRLNSSTSRHVFMFEARLGL